MADAQAYRWAYDRASAEGMLRREYATFSVGVFQWLPKLSGKGLKRSSVAIRVQGYTAEPSRVFARADQLCDELNKAAVRAHALPPWVQKQYSVPKPDGYEEPRTSNDLT